MQKYKYYKTKSIKIYRIILKVCPNLEKNENAEYAAFLQLHPSLMECYFKWSTNILFAFAIFQFNWETQIHKHKWKYIEKKQIEYLFRQEKYNFSEQKAKHNHFVPVGKNIILDKKQNTIISFQLEKKKIRKKAKRKYLVAVGKI